MNKAQIRRECPYVDVRRRGYLDIRELEAYLNVSRHGIYNWIGKYGGLLKLNDFPKRDPVTFLWKIYDVDLYLGKIKKGDKMRDRDMKIKERLVGTAIAAETLGYTLKHLQILVREGKVPAYKVGRCWKFSPDELIGFAKKDKGRMPNKPKQRVK